MKKVSIIVPVYNVEKYLKECIVSLISQTYKNIEIILIEDGSPDNCGVICDEFAKNDERIKVIHQKNAGAANAKNAGLDVASGQYITFMDSDDVVELNWIEYLVNLLEEKNVDMVECAYDEMYVNDFKSVENNNQTFGLISVEDYLKQYLPNWSSSLFWTKLFKKELTENIRFRKERRCIDDEFYTYKVVSNAKIIYKTDKVLYHYRQRKSSAVNSTKNQLQITDDAMELRVERYEWIKHKFPTLKKLYIENDINFLIFWANNSLYDEKNVKKYKEVSKYYFKEAIKLGLDFKLLSNALLFLKTTPKINNVKKTSEDKDLSEYFM